MPPRAANCPAHRPHSLPLTRSVHWLADGKGAHKFHFAESVPYDDTTSRAYGWALAGMAAMPLAISAAEGGKVGGWVATASPTFDLFLSLMKTLVGWR